MDALHVMVSGMKPKLPPKLIIEGIEKSIDIRSSSPVSEIEARLRN